MFYIGRLGIGFHGVEWCEFSFTQVIRALWSYWRIPRVNRIRKGTVVEDCRYQIHKVKKVEVVLDTVILDDDFHCSLWHCGLVIVSQ